MKFRFIATLVAGLLTGCATAQKTNENPFSNWPAGTAPAEVGKRVPIKVRVIKKDDEITIDLTEVSRQVRGYFNSGPTTGYACAEVAYKCMTSPTDYPINAGSFRSLKVKLTPGTVISDRKSTRLNSSH